MPYLNTLMMNLCQQELERRGLSIPLVSLPEESEQSGASE